MRLVSNEPPAPRLRAHQRRALVRRVRKETRAIEFLKARLRVHVERLRHAIEEVQRDEA